MDQRFSRIGYCPYRPKPEPARRSFAGYVVNEKACQVLIQLDQKAVYSELEEGVKS